MKQGQRLVAVIEKPAAGGRMIARHEGAVILVSGVIPGETVEVEVERVQRGTAWGRPVRVLEASPDRQAPPVDAACGGNVFAHVAYPRQLTLKRDIVRDAFTRIGRLALPDDITTHPSPSDGYRMRARLHARRGRLGFFREGTHELCSAGSAGQLLPDTVAAVGRLEAAIASVPAANVTEVEVTESLDGGRRAAHLELGPGGTAARIAGLPAVDGWHGISWSPAGGEGALALHGEPVIADEVACVHEGREATVTLRRHAKAFFQANRFLLPSLVSTVAARVGAGPVIDLYAGVGLFGVALAALGWREVVAVEGDPWSAADLEENARPWFDAGLAVAHQSVEDFLSDRGVAAAGTTAIVDPPRTGLSRDALAGLLHLAPARVVYVSCDIATLARDARLLVEAGYSLGPVEIFDLFPNTAHVETVVTFERVGTAD